MKDEGVRDLLERAVEEVHGPARDTEAVFAGAARVRARRRVVGAAVAAAVVAVVSAGVAGLPSPGGERQAGVASTPTAADGAPAIVKLLPEGIGEVREVSLVRIIKDKPDAPQEKKVGPYDGDYAVERGGGTGYVWVRVQRKAQGPKDYCALLNEGSSDSTAFNCATDQLPDGSRLTIWEWAAAESGSGGPVWGEQMEARLVRQDGTSLRIATATGFSGTGEQGPELDSYPLTRAQLRELALRPELLP